MNYQNKTFKELIDEAIYLGASYNRAVLGTLEAERRERELKVELERRYKELEKMEKIAKILASGWRWMFYRSM